MEARIKETGLVITVYFESEKSSNSGTPIWIGQVNHEWRTFNEKELEFISYIDWKKVRTDIAMSMIRNADWQGFCGINFTDTIFNKANELTKKLMEDIK